MALSFLYLCILHLTHRNVISMNPMPLKKYRTGFFKHLSFSFAIWNARYSADWGAGGYLAAWGLETTSHWPHTPSQATGTLSPLPSRLCEDNTTSPVVSSAIRDRRAFSQGVGVPSLLLLHLHLHFHLHPTDWKLMPCRYSGRSSLGVARSVAPPFNMIGNSSNMYSFYWKLIALWQ